MLDYIALYPNPHEDEFNMSFINNAEDLPMEEFIIMAMKELERIENVEILSTKVIRDQDEVDINYHMININYKKKDLNDIEIPKFKYIDDSRYGEVRFKIKISTNLQEKIVEKRILMPLMDSCGLYLNNGKRMKAIKQLVDASIYSQRGKITLKSKMPIILYCNKNRPLKDIYGEEHYAPSLSYACEPTKSKGKRGITVKRKVKFINPLMIYASKMGISRTIEFFGMKDIVSVVGEYNEKDEETNYIFPLDSIYVMVNKEMFEKYRLVKEFTCMMVDTKSKVYPVTMSVLNDKRYWICRVGFVGSAKNTDLASFYEKGITQICIIEQTVRLVSNRLRLPKIYDSNFYYILYWMLTNFDELKSRNNIDMKNKRVRVNEYMVDSSLGKKINENINKFIETKSKSRMNIIDTVLELLNFPSDIIVSNMRNLNDLLKSDELVNDLTFLQDIAYSAKGPNSLGEGSPNSIANKYRYVHESMVGSIELFATSNSNYGLSGYFTPFVKTYNGYYFTPEGEPCSARYEFDKALHDDEHMEVDYDVSSLDNYFDDMWEKQLYAKEFTYEPLVIIEREEPENFK